MLVADRDAPVRRRKRGDGGGCQIGNARGRRQAPMLEHFAAEVARNLRSRIDEIQRLRHAGPRAANPSASVIQRRKTMLDSLRLLWCIMCRLQLVLARRRTMSGGGKGGKGGGSSGSIDVTSTSTSSNIIDSTTDATVTSTSTTDLTSTSTNQIDSKATAQLQILG